MKSSILATLAFAVAAASTGPVFADPPGGVPPGLAKKGVSAKEWKHSKGHDDKRDKKHDKKYVKKGHKDDRYRHDDRHEHDARHDDHDRHDHVVVVDRDRDQNRDRRVIVVGQPMPQRVDYVIVRDYSRYRVPPPPRGYSYYQADGQLYQVADGTNQVALVLGALSALLR